MNRYTGLLLLSFLAGLIVFVEQKTIPISVQASNGNDIRYELLLSNRTSTDDKSHTLKTDLTPSPNETVFPLPTRLATITPPAFTFFILLVIQAGCQPILVKLFMPTTIIPTTAVLGIESTKMFVSILLLTLIEDWRQALDGWDISGSISAAGIPAGLFVIQNYCNLMANQILPPITFVLLNQTKTMSTAWWCFILMGQRQSTVQMVALVILVFSTLVVQNVGRLRCAKLANLQRDGVREHTEDEAVDDPEDHGKVETLRLLHVPESPAQKSDGQGDKISASRVDGRNIEQESDYEKARQQLTMGVLPALCASILSGLAGTLAQQTLQNHRRSPHLFNMELAFYSVIFVLASLAAGSPDYQKIKENGVRQGWTLKSWIPIVSSGFGGILVGLVTKYQGAVIKSFAMIFSMVVSGVGQQAIFAKEGGGVTKEQLTGALFGALSLYLHASYPSSIQTQ